MVAIVNGSGEREKSGVEYKKRVRGGGRERERERERKRKRERERDTAEGQCGGAGYN